MYPSARFLKSIFTRGQAQLLSSWWQFFSRKDKDSTLYLSSRIRRACFVSAVHRGGTAQSNLRFCLILLLAWDPEYSLLFVLEIDETYAEITCACQLHCQHTETEWFSLQLMLSMRQNTSQRRQSLLCTSDSLCMPQWLCRLHYRSMLLPGVCKHALALFSQGVACMGKS